MTKAQRADRLLRDSACWQDPCGPQGCPSTEDCITAIEDIVWGAGWGPDHAENHLWAASLAAGRVAALGFDLASGEKVAYLTAAGWAAWPPLPPAPPPTLTAAEKRAKAEGKEPTRGQRDRWDTQRGPWPRETTKARGR